MNSQVTGGFATCSQVSEVRLTSSGVQADSPPLHSVTRGSKALTEPDVRARCSLRFLADRVDADVDARRMRVVAAERGEDAGHQVGIEPAGFWWAS